VTLSLPYTLHPQTTRPGKILKHPHTHSLTYTHIICIYYIMQYIYVILFTRSAGKKSTHTFVVCVCVSSRPVIVIPDSLVIIITVSSDVHKILYRIRYVVIIIIIIVVVVVVINRVTIILLAPENIILYTYRYSLPFTTVIHTYTVRTIIIFCRRYTGQSEFVCVSKRH